MGLPAASWAAWQIDRACWEFGEWLDAMLAMRDRHGTPKYKLSELLADTQAERDRQFAPMAPVGMVKRMKIPDSGVW
jgi:hypothetical protein